METEFRQSGNVLVHGIMVERENDSLPWRERNGEGNGGVTFLQNDLWFNGLPIDVLERCGVTCSDAKRAADLFDLFEGEISGFYYVAEACLPGSEEAILWIMGALAAHLNENGLKFKDASRVLSADYLRTFCAYKAANRFSSNFAKDIFADLLKADRYETYPDIVAFHVDHITGESQPLADISWDTYKGLVHSGRLNISYLSVRRRSGPEVMDAIVDNPKYKTINESEIDRIIDKVLADNPKEVEKAKQNPRAVAWFVGQVMKASKGKAVPQVVQAKLAERFPTQG